LGADSIGYENLSDLKLQSISASRLYITDNFHRDSLWYTTNGINIVSHPLTGLSYKHFTEGNLHCRYNAGTLYYLDEGPGIVYVYHNATQLWDTLMAPITPASVISFVADDNYLFAGVYSIYGLQLYRSVDSVTWTLLNNALTGELPLFDKIVRVAGSGAFSEYITHHTFGRMFYSGNNGATWTRRTNGLYDLDASYLAEAGGTLLVSSPSYGVVQSIDNGNTWNYSNNGLGNFLGFYFTQFTFALDNDVAYAIHQNDITKDSVNFYSSTNFGNTWVVDLNAPKMDGCYPAGRGPNMEFLAVKSKDSLGIESGDYYMFNADTVPSASWTKITDSLPQGIIQWHGFSAKDINDSIFLFGTSTLGNKKIFLSTDRCMSWLDISAGIGPNEEYMVKFENWGGRNAEPLMAHGGVANRAILTGIDISAGWQIVFYTFNNTDTSWVKIMPTGLPNSMSGPVIPTDFKFYDGWWYIVTTAGVFRSNDYCHSFLPFSASPNYSGLFGYSFQHNWNTYFLGTLGSSIWRTSDPYSIENISQNAISIFPNPANETINISFAQDGIYSVAIYDLAGKEVFRSGNTFLSSSQNTIDVSSLHSGMYILKADNGHNILSTKLMIY
jgi:hypothetical protein